MNHLTDYGCPDIQVPFILRDEQEYISMLLQTPDFRFKDFRAFLETKRWELNSNGVLQSYQTETSHWGTKQRILQGWLFFALIACIVRTDEPLLNFGDLVKSNYLTTANLPEKLQVWHDWAKNNSERAELRKRLIEADRALELARKVIYNNLVESRFDLEMNISLSDGTSDNVALPNAISGGKAGNDYHATDFQKGQNSDRDGPLSLCLMVLGETLTAAKFQIMKDLGLRINGWFTNEDEGWGPPSYIIKSMEQSNWCPNALKVMRGQLGSSAILLSAALKVRSQEAISPEQHQNCTPEKCVHVPGQTPGRASARDERKYTKKRISYPPQHHEQLCDMKECEPLGPKMGDVYKILERADLTTEAPDFPLFRIISENIGVKVKPVDRPVRGITVEKWTREDNRKYWRPSFAAISHVWSQGMGNESANELQSCQLKLIRTALQKADIDNGEWDTETFSFSTPLIKKALGDKWIRNRHYFLSKPFWMDTLAIPVKDDGRDVKSVPANFTELKKRAIRQIYQVFNSATCTIVIDKDLCKTFSDPILIRILTSAWMRRLWSLQEAFLSRRLLFAFKGDDGVILQDMDKQIGGQYGLSNANSTALHLSMAELNKRKLYQNLMGDDREVRNRRDHPIETRGSMVIASAWRSSRWRVSHFQVVAPISLLAYLQSKPPSVLTPVLCNTEYFLIGRRDSRALNATQLRLPRYYHRKCWWDGRGGKK